MSLGVPAHRRKVSTYGKTSHKPMFKAAASFSQAIEPDLLDRQVVSQSKDQGTLKALHDLQTHARTQPGSLQISGWHEQTKRTHGNNDSTLVASRKANDAQVFDFPSSDDGLSLAMGALDPGPRKKRKINIERGLVGGSPVYDDASLQRHIALETGIYNSQSPPRSASDRNGTNLSATGRSKGSMQSKSRTRSPSLKCGRAAKAQASHRKGDGLARSVIHRPKPPEDGKACSRPRRKMERSMKSHSPPGKVFREPRCINDDDTRSTTPTKRSSADPSMAPNGKGILSSRPTPNSQPPSTPPRSVRHPEGSTTPRQHELWNRLLPNERAATFSPSAIDLPGLILSDKTTETSTRETRARKITWASSQPDAANLKPRRIIDSLLSSGLSQDITSEGSIDERSENSSESMSTASQSEGSAANGAVTGQTSPSANSNARAHQPYDPALSSSQPVTSLHGVGLKVTYARQRSYLTESDLDDVAMLSMVVAPEPVSHKGIRRRGRWEPPMPNSQSNQTLEEELENSQESQGGAMRSIHELREAGGNVRLVGELEAMLDDIEEQNPPSGSLRRTRLVDLMSKLQEQSNCRLFLDKGLESRLLAQVNRLGDLVTNSLLAAAILQLLASSTSPLLLAQASTPRVVKYLIGLLEHDEDLRPQAKLREYNLSKYARQEFVSVCNSLLTSQVWRTGKPNILTCHILALQCLEYLVRQTRESGCLSEILSAYAIRRIVASAIPVLTTPLPQRTAMSGIGVELAISILESSTISNSIECQESLWEGDTLERVAGLLPLLDFWGVNECATSRILTLRLYVNLTNNSPGLCEEFSTPEIVKVIFKMIISRFEQLEDHALRSRHEVLRDNLILSLGAFVNLAESSDIVRRLVMSLDHQGRQYLDVLLELFITKSKSAAEVYSEEETSLNVALGYLSVLLGFLSLNQQVKHRVSAHLPGGTSKQLVDALEEFLQYYRQIDREIFLSESDGTSRVSYVNRLEGLVEDLKC